MRAVLEGWLCLPFDMIGGEEAALELQKRLTYQPMKGMDGTTRDPVHLYARDWWPRENQETISVPQAFGRHLYPDLDFDDQTTTGAGDFEPPRLPSPFHPSVRDPEAQERFMQDMMTAATEHRTFVACAPTGTGKTVVGLNTAGLLGHKTLVLVHLKQIRDQWVEGAVEHLGLPRERVGIVEGSVCQWRDRDVVCGMLQSVAYEPGRYGEEFYRAFGTVIFDEVHRVGAPVFSQAVWQFPARYRIGLSATPDRKDKGSRVFFWHLGQIQVTSDQEAAPIQVYPLWYDSGDYRLWGSNHGSRVKCLSQDPARNRRIAGIVKRMYDAGRQAIVVAEGINHLQNLIELSHAAGVPRDAMGQFTNEIRFTERVTTASGKMQLVARKKKQSASTLARVKAESQIKFATYGMIKEGVDMPDLDAGLDATPRSDATQLIGRTRRQRPGKKSPSMWVTVVDVNCDMSLRYYKKRLVEYQACNAEVMEGVR